jgi:peptidoglycan/xylan/chitin deacetylase (PgdA/CDA1 family)
MITVAFRLDDPSETSHQGVEAGILDCLQRHGTTATFAAIPFRMVTGERRTLSAARARPLIDAANHGVIEIALHGNTHIQRQPDPAPRTEFAGRTPNDQQALISEGRDVLEHVFARRVSGFVPPWNSYDLATLTSVERLGFDYVSAGWEQPRRYRGKVKQLPRTANLSTMSQAITEARRFKRVNLIMVVVLHHYDFVESGSNQAILDLKGFDAAIRGILEEPHARIQTLGEIAETFIASPLLTIMQHWLAPRPGLGNLLPTLSVLDAPLWRGLLAGVGHS